eukprot:evm.model.scf_2077.3 EVM.evm.TU.scf_2077.3   scf_2077:25857-26462(-)
MAGGGAARSCLSECLRRHRRGGPEGGGEAAAQGGPAGRHIAPPAKTARSSRNGWGCGGRGGAGDVGREIQQILSSDCDTDRSAVFGCSPPLRALNPLCRDGQFRRCMAVKQPQGLHAPAPLPSVKSAMNVCSAVLPQV